RIGLSAGLAVLTILAVCLVAFAAGRLVGVLRPRLHPDPRTLDVIDFILAGLLFFASFIVRIVWLSQHASEINDASGLFDEAMIVADGSNSLTDLLSILTAGIVSVFLRIAGNRIMVGSVVMAVMQVVMIICFYFVMRILTGRVAALISTGIIGFIPAYFTRLTVVQNQVTFFMLFAMEFLVVALYLHFDAKGSYASVWHVLWFIAVGVCMGYMAYVDFATIILWIPMLLTLMLPRTEKKEEAVRLLIVFGASFIMFLIMLIQEDGISYLTDTIPNFFSTYFSNTNTVLIFHLPVEVYPVYLIIVTAMSFLIVTFWRDQTRDFTTLWLLFFLAAVLIVPLFGPTRMNAQDLLCFSYATVIGAGVTCLIAPPKKRVKQAQEAQTVSVMQAGAGMVPAGMVLPAATETDDGLPHMQMPVPEQQMPLGLDRGQEVGNEMNENMMMDQNIPVAQPGMMPGAVPGQIPVAAPGQIPIAAPGQMPAAMEQPLSKAELKAQAKAQKAQAKAEAKA
ncbi:MAG: glycosyltransferase family 39 protein, partial [Lachnospiraceae bacterium]|nr:glycosyltransferase family 39 protein [Lachnospiraceae bacterium]